MQKPVTNLIDFFSARELVEDRVSTLLADSESETQPVNRGRPTAKNAKAGRPVGGMFWLGWVLATTVGLAVRRRGRCTTVADSAAATSSGGLVGGGVHREPRDGVSRRGTIGYPALQIGVDWLTPWTLFGQISGAVYGASTGVPLLLLLLRLLSDSARSSRRVV